MLELELYVYGLIFLAVILLVEGVFYIVRDANIAQDRASNRRVRLQSSGLTPSETLRKLKRERIDVDTGKSFGKRVWKGPLGKLDRLLDESGLMVSTGRFILVMASVTLIVFFAMALGAGVPPLIAIPIALMFGVTLPVLYLMRMKAVRYRKLSEQLPDGIDMIVRSVRAGHPIRTAFSLVAREFEDPIGSEFGIMVDEMTYGLDLNEAMENLQRRIDIQDVHYFAVTVNVQHGTGGNLAEVLANLSSVIRDRFRMYKKIRALSAEGRLAAAVIACVPFFTAIIMTINKPNYYIEAAKNPIFPFIVAAALLLYLGSMAVVYKIVKIRV